MESLSTCVPLQQRRLDPIRLACDAGQVAETVVEHLAALGSASEGGGFMNNLIREAAGRTS
jgi:hypothetical protein